MSLVKFTPIVSDARGKIGDAVFSSWKGRAYIRTRVDPANPNTAAQQAVRNSLARCVELWQYLEEQVQNDWGDKALPYRYSGFNLNMSQNRADEQAGNLILLSYQHPDITPMTDFAAVTGVGVSGDIDCSWTDPGQGAGYYAYVATREVGTNIWVVQSKDTVLTSAAAVTLSGLNPAKTYDVYGAVEVIADNEFSRSYGTLAVAPKA